MRNILTVPVQRMESDRTTQVQDLLAVEEPLEIRVNTRPVSITMRTPGQDFELAAGFLLSEGIVASAGQIARIRYSDPENSNPRQAQNSVSVDLHDDVEVDWSRLERHFYTSSSCGVCGKASIESIESLGCRTLPFDSPVVHASVIHALPDALRQAQPVFERTGGLHASALFSKAGELLALREDVGRHNALDKLLGGEFLAGRTPLEDRIVLLSGRVSFELVQKAVMAGVAVLAAVGAPSSLAVELAQRYHLTLLGFVRDARFNVYAGAWRVR